MDFLTPEEKRWRTVRFIVGYILITIAVLLATFISVLLVQGYKIGNGGSFSQKGLVNVGSQPVSAEVFLDNQKVDNTPSRLDINEGEYSLRLQANDYRPWNKKFKLDGGAVRYFTYPKLIPIEIKQQPVVTFTSQPSWASSSPDRHWVVAKLDATDSPTFNVYDTTRVKPDSGVNNQNITLPLASVIGAPGVYGSFEPVEWADDNKHLLLLQTLPTGEKAYIIFNRDKPEESQNVTKLLSLTPNQVISLRDKKYNKFLAHSADNGLLIARDSKDISFSATIAEGVVAFKAYANDLILYVTYNEASPSEANLLVKQGDKDVYRLQPLLRDPTNFYLLDIAKYDGDWFYVAASGNDRRVRLFINPLSRVTAGSLVKIRPTQSIPIENPKFISFSDNARFIATQSGNRFAVYDGELKTTYRYSLNKVITDDQEVTWMDGHRLKYVDNGSATIFEFDGTNEQQLISSLPNNAFNAYFDRGYEYVFTYQLGSDGKTTLQAGSLVVQNN